MASSFQCPLFCRLGSEHRMIHPVGQDDEEVKVSPGTFFQKNAGFAWFGNLRAWRNRMIPGWRPSSCQIAGWCQDDVGTTPMFCGQLDHWADYFWNEGPLKAGWCQDDGHPHAKSQDDARMMFGWSSTCLFSDDFDMDVNTYAHGSRRLQTHTQICMSECVLKHIYIHTQTCMHLERAMRMRMYIQYK